MKKKLIFSLFSILFVLLVMPVMAQVGGLPAVPTLPGIPEAAPIDGGLSLLVAAGVGYGIKKLREKRKSNSTPDNK